MICCFRSDIRFWLLSEEMDTYHCSVVIDPLQQQICLSTAEAVQLKCNPFSFIAWRSIGIELLPVLLQSLESSEQSRYDEQVTKILAFLIKEVCNVTSSLSLLVQYAAWQVNPTHSHTGDLSSSRLLWQLSRASLKTRNRTVAWLALTYGDMLSSTLLASQEPQKGNLLKHNGKLSSA